MDERLICVHVEADRPLTALEVQMASSERPSKKCLGIFTRKERWGLSWRGWLVLILVAGFIGYETVSNAHSFLAVTHRVNTKALVVEGWIQGYGFQAAAKEFNSAGYDRIFTTGGPENGSGGYVNDYQTLASAAAEELEKGGIPEKLIQVVPSH